MPLLRFAKTRAPLVPLVLADMRSLPVRPGSVDGIWAAASLMHVPKPVARQVLVTLWDCVRPNGLLAGPSRTDGEAESKREAGCPVATLRAGKRTNWRGRCAAPSGRCCLFVW